MSGPLIFISRSRVKPGWDEQYHAHLTAANDLIESEEPQMIAFHSYRSEDGTEVSTVQVHPDADSLDTHFKLFRERLSDRVYDALDSYEIDIYGRPTAAAQEWLENMAANTPGLRLRILPLHDSGFLRPQPM